MVAARLVAVLRSGDTVCRWGGDEFLILIPDSESREDLLRVAARLLAALAETLSVPNATRSVSASIGIASFPDNGDTAEALRVAADAALLGAKRAGKDQAVLAPATSGVPPADESQPLPA